ncbi:MAG: amidohydrolase family protein [Planctomycetota bacterium]
MSMLALFLALGASADPTPLPPAGGILAIRVGRAETATKGVIENAVILVEGGRIVTIGEDLPVERGIPILDKPKWVVIPGLVDAYSRLGLDGEGGDDNSAQVKASDEIYPGAEVYEKVVEYGVTTLGLYPAGNGITGQAVAIRPRGKTREEMVILDPAYLKIILRATASSKKLLRDGFKKADEYREKEKKAREKWEKDQEKKKKSPAKKDEKADEKKTEDKKEEKKDGDKSSTAQDDKEEKKEEKKDEKSAAKDDVFVPPVPDPKVKPFLDLRSGALRALFSVSGAAEYLHLLDALDDEKIEFDLRIPLSRESDIFYIADKKTYDLDVDGIGDRKCRVVLEPLLTFHPGTMRQRNLPMELSRAGAKVVFVPRDDDLSRYKSWLSDVGELVGAGLDRETALRALTSEAAALLGVGDRLGSLEKGKDANLVFLSGDPFEPATRIQAVMLDGRFVFGEVNL